MSSILHAGGLEETNVSSNDSLQLPRGSSTPKSDRSLAALLSPGEVPSMIIVGAHDSVAGRHADRRRGDINRQSAAILVNESVRRSLKLVVSYTARAGFMRTHARDRPARLNDGDEHGRVIIRISAQSAAMPGGGRGRVFTRVIY